MPSVGQTIREWRRTPWLAASIVGTIALCVGANVAVFTLVRSVILAPLPYPGAAGLVAIGARPAMPSTDTISITPAAFFQWRSQPSFGSSVAAYYPDWNLTLVEPGESRRLVAAAVSSNLLQVLGLRVGLGRTFAPEEEWTGTGHQVILSHELWRERFGSRSDIIGSEILLGADGWPLGRQRSAPGGTRFTVVGVLGEGASLPDGPVHLLVPLRALGDDPFGLTPRILRVIGRVGAGKPALARSVLTQRLAGVSLPGPLAGSTPWVAPLRDVIVGDTARFLGIVAGAVGLILLLGCANLATLVLLRSAARTRETAVRIAIGARSRDLARLVFADALLLGILGGLGALAVARAGLAVATPVLAADLPRVAGVTMDAAVVGIALVVAVSCVLVPGVIGLARFPRHAPYELLRDGHRAVSPTAAGGRLRAGLIVTQLVLGLALVAAAGLLVRSVNGLLRTDVGFDATGVSTMTLTLPRGLFARPVERIHYFERAIEEVRRIPGVAVASATSAIPLRDVEQRVTVAVTDEQLASPDRRVPSGASLVFSGYFDAMRMRLRAGRDFTAVDAGDSLAPRVAIVNEAFASAYLRGAEALGARVAVGSGDNPLRYTVVGVVNDTRHRALRSGAEPHLYMNAGQVMGSTMTLVIRSRAAMPVVSRARATVAALHPLVQPYDEITLADVVARAMVRERVTATLLTALSALAVVLLAIGVFGLMSALVSERSREMAIRMALGASPRLIARHVLSHAAGIVAVATLVGLPIAWGSAHAIESLLYGVTPSSLTAYVWGLVAIAAAALLASVGPVRRAVRIDPLAVMRGS